MLRVLAASPIGAHAFGEQLKVASATMAAGASGMGGTAPQPIGGDSPVKFTDFAAWLKTVGRDSIAAEAHGRGGMDPDLIEMRLPLATKMRMQRQRNYERILEERKNWFERTLRRDGVLNWWP